MADKNQQVYPLAPANGNPCSDAESLSDKEAKRKKRTKLIIYIGIFAVFQVIVILIFGMVVMKVHRPKFRIGPLRIQTLTTTQSPAAFTIDAIAPIRIKNANFGPYKYDATVVTFTYDDAAVATVNIPKSKANFMSTRKIDATVSINSGNLPASSVLSSGVITLRSTATMNGKVELMLIFKKKKSTTMDCTMLINTASKMVQSIECDSGVTSRNAKRNF